MGFFFFFFFFWRACNADVHLLALFRRHPLPSVVPGRRWRCNICGLPNETPSQYYCHLRGDGRRNDTDERPELHAGCVEFVAPAEYMVRPPQAPVYMFVLDVSPQAQARVLFW